MGMVVVDLETRVLDINRVFCLLLGYTPAELIGKKSSYYTHPDDLGINAEVVDTLLSGKISVFHGEKRYIRKNGNTVWARVTGTVIRDEDGKPVYGLGMVEDITDQKSAEETIRQTNQELQIQAAAKHEHIQRFERVFEMGPIGMCVAGPDLKLSKVNKPMCDITGYTEEELTGIKFEEITHPDDVDIDVELAGQLFRGEIPFYQIEKRYIRKDGSICWVHLTASLVRGEGGAPLYGLAMVKDIQERKIAEDVDLVTVLASKGRIEADSAQLEQVIVNLVVNARHAMPGGGKLKIETEDVTVGAKSTLAIDDTKRGGYVRLGVTDTGIGMDPDTVAHIFEPFFTTKEKGQGTGLGLAAVYGIVRQSQGTITVDSHPGSGTVFKIYLPHTSQEAVEPEATDEWMEASEGAGKSLLLEDDEDLRTLFAAVLLKAGYAVTEFADAQHARRSLKWQDLFDLVVTDVVMPGMSGPQFVKWIRCAHPRTRVLYMSGYAGNELSARPLEDGSRLLEKPFTPSRLLQAVNEALRDRPAES